MATVVTHSSTQEPKLLSREATADIVTAASVAVEDEINSEASGDTTKKVEPSRPLIIYTRPQILLLYRSPLVKPPPDMPSLKDWFGMENEQSLNKKEPEPSTPGSSRDRRFRRDAEDGENTSRPAFRSTLSQPSQMGNFKHQSLRAERERDKDAEKDRDIRDKEGQEKLRNLSDKYDRDRLVLPSALTNLRSKERDTAPHLVVGSSSRTSVQSQAANMSSRRADTRDPSKKKAGESSEDWRRGAEPPRSGRDERERSDNIRKDRDEWDGLRPHTRDTSRQRRDTSASKKDRDQDRDRDRRDRDREDRDRDRRLDRDRDEPRRERDDFRKEREDFSRRDRDSEREWELDDPRRWRDDGKRDERINARRERERARDRAPQETGYDPRDRYPDRRWTVVEERDVRSKRSSGRERRSGGVAEDGKDKDDRKDREREKEKEPAWMDTYIPNDLNTGILGGQVAEGELDGIQAWKKGLKEKDKKDQGPTSTKNNVQEVENSVSKIDAAEKPLDEIQLFRLMMKREEEKKRKVAEEDAHLSPLASALPVENGIHDLTGALDQRNSDPASSGDNVSFPNPHVFGSSSGPQLTDNEAPLALKKSTLSTQNVVASVAPSDDSRSLMSIFKSSSHESGVTPKPSLVPPADKTNVPASRIFPSLPSSESSVSAQSAVVEHAPAPPSTSAQFIPPPGSRLLAFGARTSPAVSNVQNTKPEASLNTRPHVTNGHPHTSNQPNTSHPFPLTNNTQSGNVSSQPHISEITFNQGYSHAESNRTQQGFSPFGDQPHSTSGLDESRLHSDLLRRASEANLFNELANSGISGISGSQQITSADLINNSGAGAYAAGKGSRFAKFFDGKSRDGTSQAPPVVKAQTPGLQSSSPILGQRQEASNFNGVLGVKNDNRAMDDIFAMLNNSAQISSTNVPFGQGPSSRHSLQQIHQHHLPANSRLEALYDSRMDDRNFVPDGMVPGLRSAPPRSRDNSMFSEMVDESMQFNPQRLPPHQRSLEQMYSGSLYQQATVGRNVGIPLQQPHYRGGPSPISSQNPQGLPQRLPPGLANLGGRPPHEPSQFLGMLGVPSNGLHNTLQPNGPSQPFNAFIAPSSGGHNYGGGLQMRLPPPGPHQLQSSLALNPMAGLGHPGNVDLRGPSHAHVLGMGSGIGGPRGASGFSTQQAGSAQLQAPPSAARQQQHLPSHMMPPPLPPHLQQPTLPSSNNQPAHDLMALLMGGPNRE